MLTLCPWTKIVCIVIVKIVIGLKLELEFVVWESDESLLVMNFEDTLFSAVVNMQSFIVQ